MATPVIKALASTRPFTMQQVRKTICYSDQSQSRTKLLYRLQAPHSSCVFSLKSKKRVTRPPKKLDVRLYDDSDFDELRVVLQNAATHVFGKKKRMLDDWFHKTIRWRNSKAALRQKSGQAYFEKAYQRAQEIYGSNIELKKQIGTFRRRMPESYYATLNAVYGPRSRSYHPVISKDGELLTPPDKIKDT